MNGEIAEDARQKFDVRRLDSDNVTRWDNFVHSHAQGTFYHLSGWKNVIENTLGHPTFYLYCEDGEEIVAVLPLAQVKSLLFGNALVSLPFLVYGGPVSNNEQAEKCLVQAATELADSLNADYLELRNKRASTRGWPGKTNVVTFSRELDADPEKNLLAIPRKQRAMVRKGIKAGLVAEQEDKVDRLYDALLSCKRNLGTPFFGRRYLQAIKAEFADKAEILTVLKDRQTICSVMSFRFRDEILPYYGGGGVAARQYYGNDFMYWAVMEKACLEGVRVFDYGRSTVGTGSYRFKKHWGFEPEPLAYEFYLRRQQEVPHLNPANAKYRLLIDTWKRLPLGVAGMLGPPIARRLG